MELEVGTRIYYGGDMANHPGRGVITDKIPAGRDNPEGVSITMDNGRIMKMISVAMFGEVYKGNGSTNFVTEAEYQRFRNEAMKYINSYCHK